MKTKFEKAEILKKILNSKLFTHMPIGIHGRGHANRVFVLANTLSNIHETEQSIDNTAIMISSLLHDCGRVNNGHDPYHGVNSAEKALDFIREAGISCNRELVKECITRHCPPPGYEDINPSLESKIVGDADKLDRFRFHGQTRPCEADFLELPESRGLMDISSRINRHEWRSFKYLA